MKSAAEKYKAKQKARASNKPEGQAKAEAKRRKRKAFRRKHPKKVLARTQGVAEAQERTREALEGVPALVGTKPPGPVVPRSYCGMADSAMAIRRGRRA